MISKYEQFEHQADIGIRGYGETIEEAFENGARAMFNVVVNLKKVEPKKEIKVECQAPNLEELFVEWLNKLLSEAGIENLVFSEFKIKEIKKINSNYQLLGLVKGEELNLEKHEPRVEVKAATYSQLKVEKRNNQYLAQTIVDV
jgi:SHS2 domain-containing protein